MDADHDCRATGLKLCPVVTCGWSSQQRWPFKPMSNPAVAMIQTTDWLAYCRMPLTRDRMAITNRITWGVVAPDFMGLMVVILMIMMTKLQSEWCWSRDSLKPYSYEHGLQIVGCVDTVYMKIKLKCWHIVSVAFSPWYLLSIWKINETLFENSLYHSVWSKLCGHLGKIQYEMIWHFEEKSYIWFVRLSNIDVVFPSKMDACVYIFYLSNRFTTSETAVIPLSCRSLYLCICFVTCGT